MNAILDSEQILGMHHATVVENQRVGGVRFGEHVHPSCVSIRVSAYEVEH